jgi:phytoene desaturase (3,4-didehydrolycopene-forming)
MAVAARIASEKSGAKVTLLEKNSDIGGRCGSFWVDPEHDTNTKSAETATKGSSTNTNLFRHEQGPSLLLLKSVYEDVFRETTASKTARDYGLEIVPCAPAYQIVFDDGDRITAGFPKDSCSSSSIKQEESKSRAKMDAYESEGAAKWDDYMAITAAYLDAGLPNFIQEKLDLGSLPNFLVQSLKDSAKAWPLKPHSDVLDALFESDKLKALASFQDLYVGLEPFRNKNDSNNLQMLGGGVLKSTAPAVFGLLAAIELHPDNKNAGVFAPIGGFQSVTNAFENLLDDLGVEIRCDTTVLGVTNEGVWARQDSSTSSDSNNSNNDDSKTEFIPADLIIVNADLPYAKNSLIMKQENSKGDDANVKPPLPSPPPPPLPEKFDWDDQFSFSSGVISFYWSLDKPLDDLNTHNVFLSTKTRSEAEAAWQVLRDSPEISLSKSTTEHDEDSPFNFYVHRPSKTDPSAAPPGCDTIMVLVPCRTLLRDDECANLPRREAMERYQTQFTETEIARVKKAVLKRLAAVESLQTLEDHILHEECRTPATWADRYNLGAGTPFALVRPLLLLFYFDDSQVPTFSVRSLLVFQHKITCTDNSFMFVL